MNPPAAPISGRARATAVFIGLLAALAGLMFGLDIGVISGATQFIQRGFAINDHAIELIVSSMMAGAAVGALIAGFLSAYAVSPRALIGARIVLGFAIGIACSTVTNWIVNMIVGASFLILLNQFGRANTFWLYAGLNVVFLPSPSRSCLKPAASRWNTSNAT